MMMRTTRKSSETVCCRSESQASSTLHALLHCLARRHQPRLMAAVAASKYATRKATLVLTAVSGPFAKTPTVTEEKDRLNASTA